MPWLTNLHPSHGRYCFVDDISRGQQGHVDAEAKDSVFEPQPLLLHLRHDQRCFLDAAADNVALESRRCFLVDTMAVVIS